MLQKISANKIALIKRMQLSTPTLVDILDSLGKTIVLNSQLKSINLENFYSVGQAYTCLLYTSDAADECVNV